MRGISSHSTQISDNSNDQLSLAKIEEIIIKKKVVTYIGENTALEGFNTTISEFLHAVPSFSYVLTYKYSFLKPIIPDNCSVRYTFFFSILLEEVSYLCENVIYMEENSTVSKS